MINVIPTVTIYTQRVACRSPCRNWKKLKESCTRKDPKAMPTCNTVSIQSNTNPREREREWKMIYEYIY